MLYAERYAYYCDAEKDSQADMSNGDFDATEYYPDDVHQNRQTSGVAWTRGYLMSKRPKCKPCHLEQLHSERYAYDGQAEQQTHQCVIEADEETSKDNPKDIAYKFHMKNPYITPVSTLCRPCRP